MVSPVLDYDGYWQFRQECGEIKLRARDKIVTGLIEDNSSILEIGCGPGCLLNHLAQNKEGLSVLGLDISQNAIEMARRNEVKCQVADVTSPEFELQDNYDYIIAFELLEHLASPELLMLKFKGRYRKALFLTIPNVGYYPHRLRLLFGTFPVQTVWHPGEHLRYWTVSDFKEWLDQLGFGVPDVIVSNGFPRLASHWPNLLGNQIVFVLHP